MSMKQYEFWFVVGSQFLYGPEVLETVARRAAEMARRQARASAQAGAASQASAAEVGL